MNLLIYSTPLYDTFLTKTFKFKIMGRIRNEQVKQTARDNFQLLDQALIECKSASEIESLVEFVIDNLKSLGVLQPIPSPTQDVQMSGTARKLRRKRTIRKRKFLKKTQKYKR
jgi:hypothetical protein